MACSRLSQSLCPSTNNMRCLKKHFQAWAPTIAGNVKMGAPEKFWGSSRRDCNPNKQVITTTAKKPPTTTTMTVRKSETNCSAFSLPLQNFAAIKIATRTQELNYGAQTPSLSLSLKHLQNALLSEVKEKHPKIQNQIQASSLQVVAKFSLTEETRKCVTVWRGREPPSERFKTRKTQAWWSTPQVIAKILLSQKTKSTPRRDRIQNSFPNWTI